MSDDNSAPSKDDAKALATKAANTPASKAELEAYEAKLKSQQEGKFPAQYNNIRVLWDQESEDHGKLVKQLEGKTDYEVIKEGSFKCTVLATRKQYVYYPVDEGTKAPLKEQSVKTELFEDFADPVIVYKNGVQHPDSPCKPIAHMIKEICPDPDFRKYKEFLFIEVEGEVFVLIVKGASCSPWFDYRKDNANRLPFAYETEVGTTKAKNGAVTYFPLTFKKTKDFDQKEYEVNLKKSFEMQKFVDVLNHNGSPSTRANPNETEEEKQDREDAKILEILG